MKLNETEQQQFHHSVTILKDILSRYFDDVKVIKY
jgi:L-lactate dehydrogenase